MCGWARWGPLKNIAIKVRVFFRATGMARVAWGCFGDVTS